VKYFIFGTIALFTVLGLVGWLKREPKKSKEEIVQEIPQNLFLNTQLNNQDSPKQNRSRDTAANTTIIDLSPSRPSEILEKKEELPDVDLIPNLFALDASKLPIVETVSFTSRVPWMKGRQAWIADYAAHYETSRHFIARSLNREPDYITQKVSPGDRFNVFKKDKEIAFHLLVDLSRCRMWFYYIDKGTNERVLLKTYRVGVGRADSQKASGYATPIGKYQVGDKIAIYKPGTMGFFQEKKAEMIQVFGTRWIPFDKELEGCSQSSKGLGFHGAPCKLDAENNELIADTSKIGKQATDGCILLTTEDIEELFSIVITKPTVVEVVKDYRDAKLPGRETTGHDALPHNRSAA